MYTDGPFGIRTNNKKLKRMKNVYLEGQQESEEIGRNLKRKRCTCPGSKFDSQTVCSLTRFLLI